MKTRRICILLACFWVILAASTATAGLMHSDTHVHHAVVTDGVSLSPHAPQAISPFDVKRGIKPIHCKLLGHNPLLPCPHHRIPAEDKDKCFISNECGGSPFQAPTSRSLGDSPRYLVPVAVMDDDLPLAVGFISKAVFYDPFFSPSPDRPPRAL